ncbi:hypothetical protein MOQ_006505 [Trypanosoma cruzi marinkellei]|uniref:Uncharacterized protein n=1 Tax=Trypanosoma cruzi marinkellei TaxID=85056 RepID=K2N4U9_TRYCR|nr:hypothetical protein MOQ_006505 [Trypanosoma cruzi marinkellei]
MRSGAIPAKRHMTMGTAPATKCFYHKTVLMSGRTHRGRDRPTWHRYNRQPSSASEDEMLTQRRGRGFAVRQQSRRRFSLTWVGIAQQTAAPSAHKKKKEGRMKKCGGGATIRDTERRVQIDCTVCWLAAVRFVIKPLPRGACVRRKLQWWRKGTETRCGPHPPRLVVATTTPPRRSACSKDRRRQQRSVPSLSHWGATPPTPSLAHSPTEKTREQQRETRHVRRARSRKVSQRPPPPNKGSCTAQAQ